MGANEFGLSPPPLETSEGWLILYHGVRETVGGSIYRLGLALLDREDPTCVLRRTGQWIFGPEEPYEEPATLATLSSRVAGFSRGMNCVCITEVRTVA